MVIMEDESYWQIELDKVADRSGYILKNSIWTDCEFIVGSEENKKVFKAHKLFLSMASPVFQKMFTTPFLEEKKIEIVDIQAEAFGAMLNFGHKDTYLVETNSYIYTDKVEIESFDQACELCYVAKKYMIHNLLKQCTAYVLKDVNVSNACRGYEFAKLFDQVELMEKCSNVIREKTYCVLATPSFLEAQISTLLMILGELKLNVNEHELFNAMEMWTKAEFTRRGILGDEYAEERQHIYDQIVPKICFLNMSAKEFADGPAVSPLLKPEESFSILLNLTASNSCHPLPKGFSTTLRNQIRNYELIYCMDWPIITLEEHKLRAHNDSYVTFSCDKDFMLKGLMVSGRSKTQSAYDFGSFNQSEIVEIYLYDCAADTTERATVNGIDYNFDKNLRVYFPKSIKIQKGRNYKVGVLLKTSGNYPGRKLNCLEFLYKSYTFKVISSSLHVFMQGIIFCEFDG